MPGLAAVTGQKGVPIGATYLYSQSWLVSTVVSGSVYYALFLAWPFEVDDKVITVLEGIEGVERVEEGIVEVKA
jgi:NCS1 family nucleobase:cation symporter-1